MGEELGCQGSAKRLRTTRWCRGHKVTRQPVAREYAYAHPGSDGAAYGDSAKGKGRERLKWA